MIIRDFTEAKSRDNSNKKIIFEEYINLRK